jgi:hypothetical protein
MKKLCVTILLGLFILTCVPTAHAEPQEIASFEGWTVYAERSLIDGKVSRAFCARQSKNIIRSSTSMKWAILYFEMEQNDKGSITRIYVKFPEDHYEKSTATIKLDDYISPPGEWAVKRQYAIFTNKKNPLKYALKMSDADQLIIETKNNDGSIQYQAVFDMYGFAPSVANILPLFMP